MKVIIVEYKPDSWYGEIITGLTGKEYSHTEMMIGNYIYGAGTEERPDGYSKTAIIDKKGNIKPVKRLNSRPHEKVVIPFDFDDDQIRNMENYWEDLLKYKYNFVRLLGYILTIPLMGLFRIYYHYTGNVGRVFSESFMKNSRTCAEACDRALRIGGFDAFPEFNERVIYPGMFVERYGGKK